MSVQRYHISNFRSLAHEMQVPWIEHWDFLDSYADLSTSEGLDVLEEYFKKSVWIKFTKEFKELHGIEELFPDITKSSTPLKAESCDNVKKNIDAYCANKVINVKGDFVGNNASASGSPDYKCDAHADACAENMTELNTASLSQIDTDKARVDTRGSGACESPVSCDRSAVQSSNGIVSPITSLSQSFAQLSVLDDSLLDKSASNKVTISTSHQIDKYNNNVVDSESDVANTDTNNEIKTEEEKNSNVVSEEQESNKDDRRGVPGTNVDVLSGSHEVTTANSNIQAFTNNKQGSDINRNIEKVDIFASEDKVGAAKPQTAVVAVSTIDQTVYAESKDVSKYSDRDGIVNTNLKSKAVNECKEKSNTTNTEDSVKAAADDSQSDPPDHKISGIGRKHLLSDRSDSTSSFKTAEEDFYDSSLMSPFSDISAVCIKLNYSPSLLTLKEEIDSRNQVESDVDNVCLLLRMKKQPINGHMKVDIVLYPSMDNVNQLVLVEDMEVFSCDWSISSVSDGEVVDICFTYKNDEVKLKAHFARSGSLPKPGYIHG